MSMPAVAELHPKEDLVRHIARYGSAILTTHLRAVVVAICAVGGLVLGASPAGAAIPPTVDAGGAHNCGLNAYYQVVCWGFNAFGQAPATMPGQYSEVSAGADRTCGINWEATVDCWGAWSRPGVPTGRFRTISLGERHACGVNAEHRVECWGSYNMYGEAPESMAGTYDSVSAGYEFTCGVTTQWNVRCWGDNMLGKAPASVSGSFIAVSAGASHACALTWGDGRVICWGGNMYGQAPATVSGQFSAISAGRHHTCGLQTNGYVKCWGSNFSGQAPASVAGTFKWISAGDSHTCGVKTGNIVVCWGESANGRTTVPVALSPAPLQVRLTCESIDYQIACWQQTSGGTAPYRVEWFLGATQDTTKTNNSEAYFGCRRGVTYTVKVVATDAAATTTSASARVACVGTDL